MTPTQQLAKFPQHGSLTYRLARFLLGRARQESGHVCLMDFYERYPDYTRGQVSKAVGVLRRDFYYYCKISDRRSFVHCALDWPVVEMKKRYTPDGGFDIVEGRIIADPRRDIPDVRYRYPRPSPYNTTFFAIYTYILRHRDTKTHNLDCTNLFARYGTKRVCSKFSVLNAKYGFRIKRVAPCTYNIEKERNYKL